MAKNNDIPRGTGKEDVYFRRAIIVRQLMPLKGKTIPCRAFPEGVKIEFVSIDETATRAAFSYESTLVALHLVEALKKARLIEKHPIHSTKQKKARFVYMFELESNLSSLGKAKIILGKRKNKSNSIIVHYCITKKARLKTALPCPKTT